MKIKKQLFIFTCFVVLSSISTKFIAMGVTNNEKSSSRFFVLINRAVEIRYIVIEKKDVSLKEEIIIEGKTYQLFKSKEDALISIGNAPIKKDYTVVYVISTAVKAVEIVELD